MDITITLANYRCFPSVTPATFTISPGFTSLVGPNNSGKSSAVRAAYEFRALFRQVIGPNGALIDSATKKDQFVVFDYPDEVRDLGEVFNDGPGGDIIITIAPSHTEGFDEPPVGDIALQFRILRDSNRAIVDVVLGDDTMRSIPLKSQGIDGQGRWIVVDRTDRHWDLSPLQRCGDILSSAVYFGPFRNAVGSIGGSKYYDLSIGSAFINDWDRLASDASSRKNRSIVSGVIEDVRAILGFSSLDVSASNDNTTLIVTSDGRSYRLDEVGSGISQFLIGIFALATSSVQTVWIDEPELNLHPQSQLAFLAALGSRARYGVIFGTHSLGLARISGSNIYVSGRTSATGPIHLTRYGGNINISGELSELSYGAYRDSGFDVLLLVEGRNDVQIFQAWTRLFHPSGRIAVLSLGGKDMITGRARAELAEVKRVAGDVAVVIDSERSEPEGPLETERVTFRDMCEELGIRCHVLERRAVENYLDGRALNVAFGASASPLQPFEAWQARSRAWAKGQSARAAREMTRDELGETDLGKFLETL